MKFNLEEYISRIVMVCVGIICVGLSIYYSTQFYITEFNRPFIVAIMLAGAIGIFNSFSLVASTFLLRKKNYLMSAIFIPIAIAAISFDISTVVGAQSSNYIQQENIEQIIEQKTEALTLQGDLLQSTWEDLKQQRITLEERLSTAVTRLEEIEGRYQVASAEYEAASVLRNEDGSIIPNPHTAAMRSANIDRTTAQKQVTDLTAEINSKLSEERLAQEAYISYVNQQVESQTQINEQAQAALETNNNTMTQFANWLSSVLTFIPKKWIQFILVLIPALFIDLISPLAMNFGLTLAHEKKAEMDPVIQQPVKKQRKKRTPREKKDDTVKVQVQLPPIHEPVNITNKVDVIEPIKEEKQPTEIEQPIEPQIEKKEDKPTEKKTIRYRFGRTTELIANKLIDFIKLCIINSGDFVMSPEDAAVALKLNKRVKEVFLDHLASLKLGSLHLITKNKDGSYYANFSAQQIVEYATEILED